jgi:hypothetical protein
MNHSVYVTAGGGAGDCIRNVIQDSGWRRINPLKQRFQHVNVIGIFTDHLGAGYELAYANPNVLACMVVHWHPPGHELEHVHLRTLDALHINTFCQQYSIEPEPQGAIYLTQREAEWVRLLIEKPYIVVHPFAGLPHRGCRPHPNGSGYRCYRDYQYVETIKVLQEQYDYRIIVLGKSNTSDDYLRAVPNDLELPDNPEIINLQDQASLRMSAWLAMNASGFLGTHSAMLSAAWCGDVPSLFFYPSWEEGEYHSVRDYGGQTGTFGLGKTWNTYHECTPEGFGDLNPGTIADELVSNIQQKRMLS